MAKWCDVDVDFGGEETANFGPRLESGSSLYQVVTAATISPSRPVSRHTISSAQVCHLSWGH